jgi:hypothetical protein
MGLDVQTVIEGGPCPYRSKQEAEGEKEVISLLCAQSPTNPLITSLVADSELARIFASPNRRLKRVKKSSKTAASATTTPLEPQVKLTTAEDRENAASSLAAQR